MRRRLPLVGLEMLIFLGACQLAPINKGNPKGLELRYSICARALEQSAAHQAYQGFDGWFYFEHDLTEQYPFYKQTDFFAALSAKLEAQGVALMLVPIPGRALIRPDTLYLKDLKQAAFDPLEAQAAFDTFVSRLRASHVQVFDTVSAAKRYDRSGGQTFFKRDLHWRSDGANALFKEVAGQLRQHVSGLPSLELELRRGAAEDMHYGQFVNNWTTQNCGYRLPAEPQGIYTVTPAQHGAPLADVVLVGSSFSLPPTAMISWRRLCKVTSSMLPSGRVAPSFRSSGISGETPTKTTNPACSCGSFRSMRPPLPAKINNDFWH